MASTDAEAALDAAIETRTFPRGVVERVAPLPRSLELLEVCTEMQALPIVLELLRRRRCAFLENPRDSVRALIRESLRPGKPEQTVVEALRLVEETADAELIPDVVAVGKESPRRAHPAQVHRVLSLIDPRGRENVAREHASATEGAKLALSQVDWYFQKNEAVSLPTLEEGDEA